MLPKVLIQFPPNTGSYFHSVSYLAIFKESPLRSKAQSPSMSAIADFNK